MPTIEREQHAAERRDRPGEDVEDPEADDEEHERRRRARFVERHVVELRARRRSDANVAAAATKPHGIANSSTRRTNPGT